jgi:hypothetical protein
MPERFFSYRFFVDHVLQLDGTRGLTTQEIAEAAMLEIVQLELSASPFDVFMTSLLDPHTRSFRWIAQLGQIRETKTALSGLFGRFVARAYLTRYHGLQYFEPLQGDLAAAGAWPGIVLKRKEEGDLPDWIVAPAEGKGSVAIAEAKGSHAAAGPRAALDRAYLQARRVLVESAGVKLKVKRFAIVTRWAVAGDPKLPSAMLWVDDPEEGEREATHKERGGLHRSIRLGHFAALARGMGYADLAKQLTAAKIRSPGQLDLDASDLVRVKEAGGERSMMMAAVTRAGVVRIPQGATEDFQSGLISIFGDEALLIAVDLETLLAADQLPPEKAEQLTNTAEVPDEFFWTRPRRRTDGVEVLPLGAVTILGRGAQADLDGSQSS